MSKITKQYLMGVVLELEDRITGLERDTRVINDAFDIVAKRVRTITDNYVPKSQFLELERRVQDLEMRTNKPVVNITADTAKFAQDIKKTNPAVNNFKVTGWTEDQALVSDVINKVTSMLKERK